MPVFGPEYADQPEAFARRAFRSWFATLRDGTILVLDDLHCADTPSFRHVLATLLRELPDTLRCVCLSRTLPPSELDDLMLAGRIAVLDQPALEFTREEACALISARTTATSETVDVSVAGGWAAGLVLLTQHDLLARLQVRNIGTSAARGREAAVFEALGQMLFDTLPPAEQELLLQLGMVPEIPPDLVAALVGTEQAHASLERLHQLQLLVASGDSDTLVFQMHDLLRGFLQARLVEKLQGEDLARLGGQIAELLDGSGHPEDAIDLALRVQAWPLAHRFILDRAAIVLAQGRRVTLIDWCARLPESELDAWLCYWLGMAHMADDAAAETWLARAWERFVKLGDLHGQTLTAARAVLIKTDSWRTHAGLPAWTRRALQLAGQDLPPLQGDEELLVLAGLVRAFDFAEQYRSEAVAVKRLEQRLLQRLLKPQTDDSNTLRVLASGVLVQRAGSTAQADLFSQAVDAVGDVLDDENVPPMVRGLWLVDFGTVSGRYFPYARRDFPYADAEQALHAAIAIGEHEQLRSVEFGAIYHLQVLTKLRNDFAEFERLVDRLTRIADSRYSTQMDVVADCQVALHTRRGDLPEAYRACERCMAAVEAANEPPIERWPHYITHYQVLLADSREGDAASLLQEHLPQFDGGVRQRTEAAIALAHALQARSRGDADAYRDLLRDAMIRLRATDWTAVLINLPELLAGLCTDALALEVEPEFVRTLIARRRLQPPLERPSHWPWTLRVQVLGEFRLQLDGVPLALGARSPPRMLDILRVLAVTPGHTCAIEKLHDWLWPEAEGDRAKAACDQALHRLRKALGRADLVLLREGKLSLARDAAWVDLADWEHQLAQALAPTSPGTAGSRSGESALEHVFHAFTGPLLQHERASEWSIPAAERTRSKLIGLALELGRCHETRDMPAEAQSVYLRALDFYPASTRLFEALIRARLADDDPTGALAAYARYERVRQTTLDTPASAAIRRMVAPLLA
jgi:DNA-binding SARP family transcriptional activator